MSAYELKPGGRSQRELVDRPARRLVNAINASHLSVQTHASCSGHYHKPGMPYVAFRCQGWDFVQFLLPVLTGLNAATRGQTRIQLTEQHGEMVKASIRLGLHASALPEGVDWSPIVVGQGNPPKRLVGLWWRELDEIAAMIEERRIEPSIDFCQAFDSQRLKARRAPLSNRGS